MEIVDEPVAPWEQILRAVGPGELLAFGYLDSHVSLSDFSF
jgi:hypothetical protein